MPSAETRRLLLTGPGGRIGPHILPTLRARYSLRLLDRRPLPGGDEAVVADLSDPQILAHAMAGCETVVHLAATSDEAPFVEELVPNNVVGLYHVFEAARSAGVRRIVFASTLQTVGSYPRETTIAVADPVRPVTLYGATKAFGEILGRHYFDRHGIEFVGLRIGWFQDYDSRLLRTHRGCRSVWLSPRDMAGILVRAIETPAVGFAVAFATSKTDGERLSRRELREVLGYEPVDDVGAIPWEGDG